MVFLIPKLILMEAQLRLLGPGVKVVIKTKGIKTPKSIKFISIPSPFTYLNYNFWIKVVSKSVYQFIVKKFYCQEIYINLHKLQNLIKLKKCFNDG